MRFLPLCSLALACLFLSTRFSFAQEPLPGERLFGATKVVKFHFTLGEKQLAALAPAGGGGPGFGPPGFGAPRPQPEGTHRNTFGVDFPWSQGDLTFDGETFKDVGLRYKGNYTYMATNRSLKKSMKLDINRNVNDQRLDGLTMFNLHCGVSDPTQAREAFSFAFFRDAGVPASRTSFVEVTLTVEGKYENELVGLYTLTEQVNKAFLKRHYGDGSGMLLKPEGLQGGLVHLGTNWKDYEQRYKPDGKPTGEQKDRLIQFTRLIQTGTDEEFASQVGSYLDVDAFLKFIAANTLLSNLDSYLGFGHNYYLYLVPSTNQFVFIPWDLDLSLATWPAVGNPEQLVDLSIHHPHAGNDKLLDRLFAIAEHKERYLAILKDLAATTFTKEKLTLRIDEIEAAIKEPMERQAKAVADRKENRGGGGFGFGNGQFGQTMPPRRFIEKRIASVEAQLSGSAKGYEPKAFGMGGPGGPGGPGPRPGTGPGPRPGGPGNSPPRK